MAHSKVLSGGVMTSRQRMLAALRLEEPDRIPIGLRGVDPYGDLRLVGSFGTPQDSSYKPFMDFARKKLDIWHGWSPVRSDNIFLSASKSVKLRKDTYVEGDHEFVTHVVTTPKGVLNEIHGRRISQSEKAFLRVKPYIETEKDLESFMSIPYDPMKLDLTPFYKEKKRLGEAGVLMTDVPTPLGSIASLFGFEDFVKRIILSRDTIMMLFDIMFERCFDYAVQVLEAGAREVFQISGAELLAPPMFNPRYFEDFVVRYEREIIKLIHDYSGIVYLRCHGSVNAVLEMIADMGVDGLHPVEPPPMGDTPLKEAKRRIGDKVCFIGNIQIRDILYESKEKVDRDVRQAIFEGGPDGLILSTSASPSWSPLPQKAMENFIQLAETVLQYGKLPRRTVDQKYN
ncbi:MAG: uroporphyrinogen decarboxylase family protein [Candidatus Bathyarchaeota archaeon]|nr:uroporphyrinogen decarboxylase family protein [Candidatus Bathyarchaeota archaeon]